MASAFTSEERKKIHKELIDSAKKMASKYGMKGTSVEQLAKSAGISKGMFYKFYPSKEMLFFEMLESMHSEIYGTAEKILRERTDLGERERLAEAFMAALNTMERLGMEDFWENDIPYLLRKIPEDILEEHYHSDEEHISELIKISGINISLPSDVVSSLIRALILTMSHQKEIGKYYPQVLKILVSSVCSSLIYPSF